MRAFSAARPLHIVPYLATVAKTTSRERGLTPWRLQPLCEAPALISPSSGLSCLNSPKNEAAGERKVRGPFRSHRLVTRCPGILFVGANWRQVEPRRGTRWRPPSCTRDRHPHRVEQECCPDCAQCWVPGMSPDSGADAQGLRSPQNSRVSGEYPTLLILPRRGEPRSPLAP
ncbi:hypothetical protein NDU88_001189 [Pleurodeles waltl]|uniref:Uncharacterized protein n=1 Tax=Pleurodeles waltl TaxID=8319 RepID=A0AAV7P779_PLEWA|nr:hypothetical protein NDU88_001189 [Pleurodeles waltl]